MKKIIGLILISAILTICRLLIIINENSSTDSPNNNNLKIVMPFHMNQIEMVLANINKWNIFKPCTSQSNNRIEIIFYIGYLNEFNLNSNIHKLPKKLDCFSHVSTILYK